MNPRHKILTVAAISLLGVTAMPAQQPARKVPAVYMLKCVEASPAIWASPKALAQQVLLHQAAGLQNPTLGLRPWLSRNQYFFRQTIQWPAAVLRGEYHSPKDIERMTDLYQKHVANAEEKISNADDAEIASHWELKKTESQARLTAVKAMAKSDRCTMLTATTDGGVELVLWASKVVPIKARKTLIQAQIVSVVPHKTQPKVAIHAVLTGIK